MDTGRTVTFDPHEMRHFDHGYAVTSHSSQGLTAERVLVNMDTEMHSNLINARFAYVSISRGSHAAHIFTDNAAELGERLSHDVSKTSAMQLRERGKPERDFDSVSKLDAASGNRTRTINLGRRAVRNQVPAAGRRALVNTSHTGVESSRIAGDTDQIITNDNVGCR